MPLEEALRVWDADGGTYETGGLLEGYEASYKSARHPGQVLDIHWRTTAIDLVDHWTVRPRRPGEEIRTGTIAVHLPPEKIIIPGLKH